MCKLRISFPLILILYLLMGCAIKTTIPEQSSLKSCNSSSINDTEQVTTNPIIANIYTTKIDGDISNIYYAGDGKVLILAAKLHLYDLASGQILFETAKEDYYDETYFMVNNGYVGVGMRGDSTNNGGFITNPESNRVACTFYNDRLEKEEKINLDKLMNEDESILSPLLFTVSQDGTKIAYATDMGLYYYDTMSEKKIILVDLIDNNEEKRSGLAMFEEVAFINDSKTITFKSQSFDVPAVIGKPSFDTYGTINVDGTGLSVNRNSSYSVKKMIAYNAMTLWTEDFSVATGRLMLSDNTSGQSRILNLTSEKESGSVFGSEMGTYFSTVSYNESYITVRVYETASGMKVMEKNIAEDSDYMSREPVILILDNSRTCLVILGNRQEDISTIVLTFGF